VGSPVVSLVNNDASLGQRLCRQVVAIAATGAGEDEFPPKEPSHESTSNLQTFVPLIVPVQIVGGWTVSGVWMSHSGFPLAFPNAAPLAPRSAKLTDAQRDSLAQAAGRQHYDPSYDVWFDTSLFPRTAQAPFTLRTFPTRFPDVRIKPLNICDLSIYKQLTLSERVRLQIRVDAHNIGNFPWFSVLDNNGSNVTNPLFGHLRADIGNETRVIVGVMKVLF